VKLIYENWRRFINEQESEVQIYCDMDGVLVDFEGGIVDYINEDLRDESRVPERLLKTYKKLQQKLEELGRDQEIEVSDLTRDPEKRVQAVRKYMYARAEDDFEFWKNLDWTPDGKQLWAHIKDRSPQIIILTTPMRAAGSRDVKVEWVKNNLGSQYKVILEEDKWKYSGPNKLLIDDFLTNIEPWGKNGGMVVHHKNSSDSISALEKILNPEASLNENMMGASFKGTLAGIAGLGSQPMAADKLPKEKNFEPDNDLDMSVKAVVHRNGLVLLLKNKRGWDLPGGHVRQGENKISALMREIFEETGINVSNVQDLNMTHGNKHFFTCEFLTDDIILSDEHQEYGFFNLEEVEQLEDLSEKYKKPIFKCMSDNLNEQKIKITLNI
jgi:ADP-ribose pyrophosphatase YjhB (NUDIX family)/5'(3')-deoxyribonucleotidase